MIHLIFGIPMAVGATLALAQQAGGPRWLWISTSALTILGGAWLTHSFSGSSESSPVSGFFLGAGIPVVIGVLLHVSAGLRWPVLAKVTAASLLGALLVLPLFAFSCMAAELVPWVQGCFF